MDQPSPELLELNFKSLQDTLMGQKEQIQVQSLQGGAELELPTVCMLVTNSAIARLTLVGHSIVNFVKIRQFSMNTNLQLTDRQG